MTRTRGTMKDEEDDDKDEEDGDEGEDDEDDDDFRHLRSFFFLLVGAGLSPRSRGRILLL